VRTADPVGDTTSAVAAGVWFPYRAAPADAVLRWAATSLDVFRALADDPSTGVTLRPGTVVHRTAEPDLWWAPSVAGHRPARAAELPPGTVAGTRCTLPVVHMDRYLPFLQESCRAAGVTVVPGRVDRLADVPGDVVVVAAGLGSGALLGDDSGSPVQGQVVRLADPGLTGWVLDEDNPAGLTYVVPRGSDVVVGGTAVEGAPGTVPTPSSRRRCWSGPARSSPSSVAHGCSRGRSGCGPGGPPSGSTARWSTGGRSSPATATGAPASPSRGAAHGTSPRSSGGEARPGPVPAPTTGPRCASPAA
jgi:hypothetical protein